MTDTQGRKLNYHLKGNKNNLDKSNPQILTSSPTIDHKINSKTHFNNLNNFNKLDKKLIAVNKVNYLKRMSLFNYSYKLLFYINSLIEFLSKLNSGSKFRRDK